MVILNIIFDAIYEGKPVVGKNKESWLDDNLNVIPNTESYEEGQYWHCHSGPSYSNTPVKNMTIDLARNLVY